MIEDLATLAGQVAVVGGPITFVTSPARAVVISLLAHRELPFTVLGSPAFAADDLIAVATQCVVSATDAVPEISSSRSATVHMDDDPAPIATGGAVAAPARSLWQTATIGIKLRFNASWALRDPRGLAWLTTTK
jgi:hypothetical protein